MFKETIIGIIGLGFVGTAVRNSYTGDPTIRIIEIDSNPEKYCTGTYEDLSQADAVFVCVPSPRNNDGSCDSTPLLDVMSNLKNFKSTIISKVTAPPNVYEELQKEFPNLVHAPEFLTAANANQDYINGKFAIVGGEVTAFLNEASRIIKLGQRNVQLTHFCKIGEAALTKYIINSFLATKVIFMNEMAKLAEAGGQDWNIIRMMIASDERRIGNSHTQVPGPDGYYGFGGACFPKDTAAILKYASDLGCQMNVLDAAVKKNTLLRLTD